jgi:hypothetical protein
MDLLWLGREGTEWEVMLDLARAQYGRGEYMNALSIVDGAASCLPLICPGRVELALLRARSLLKVRDVDEAAASLERFREPQWQLAPRLQAELGALIAMLAVLRGDFVRAEREAEGALHLAERLGDREAQALAGLILALTSANGRQFHQATNTAAVAMQLGFATGSVLLMQELTWLLGRLYPPTPAAQAVVD